MKCLDDFDDFQSAPAAPSQSSAAAVKPAQSAPKKSNDIFDLLGEDSTFTSSSTPPPTSSQQPQRQQQQQQQPQQNNLMLSQAMSFDTLVAGSTQLTQSPVIQPSSLHNTNTNNSANSTPAQSNTPKNNTESKPIGGMWSQASNMFALDSLGSKAAPAKPAQGPSMNAMKNSSVNAGWNNWASANPSPSAQQQQPQQQKPKQSSAFDDLLF